MNRKTLITIGIIVSAVLVTLTIVTLVLFSRSSKPRPTATPTIELSPSASPVSVPEAPEEEGKEKQIAELYNQPILKALPAVTKYWALEYVGSEGKTYRLKATVFVSGNQNRDAAINRQKPYIIDYVKRTGQADGTYTIEYVTGPTLTY